MAFAALQKDADTAISNNEREFILKALRDGQRIDGRAPHELRPARLTFALDDSSCTLALGRTRVMAVVAATLDAPFGDRGNEGSLRFNVEFSPMASPAFEPGRPGEDAIEVARLVERGLRESRAVDLEALVVLAGRKVWHLRVDIHVLDHQGALADACGLAALAALMAFRRPDVTVGGGDDGQAITVHPPEAREPVPLSIHHLPLPVTFALFEEGELMVVDPSHRGGAGGGGRFTVTQNAFGELCSLQKVDGCGLTPAQLMQCIRLAALKVEEQLAVVRKALQAHDVARVQARIRRQPGAAAPAGGAAAGGAAALGGRAITVLRSDQLVPAVAPAAAGGGCGSAVALDLDSLPDSVRSILQQAAVAAPGGGDGVQSMSEDEGSSSSSDESSSSEDEEEEQQQQAAAAAAEAPPAAGGAESPPPPQEQPKPAAALPQQQQRQQQQQRAAGATPGGGKHKKRRPAPGSGSRQQQRDELAAIADMIASAGGGGGSGAAGAPDLAAAVKKQKKKARPAGGKPARQ